MSKFLKLTLSPRATFSRYGKRSAICKVDSKNVSFNPLTPGILQVLKDVARNPKSEEQMERTVIRMDGEAAIVNLYYVVEKLRNLGALCYTLSQGKRELCTFQPLYSLPIGGAQPAVVKHPYSLSRFAYLRRVENGFLLQCSLSHWAITFDSLEVLGLILQLAKPCRLQKMKKQFPTLGKEQVQFLIDFLVREHFLEVCDLENIDLLQWQFHDLLFHTQSRMGRSDSRFGGTYRFLGKIKSQPAVKSLTNRKRIALYKPSLDMLQRKGPRFTQVLESRRSIRKSNEKQPISVRSLGEFLYRVGRVKKSYLNKPGHHFVYEFATRPYPGAGACYELEIYPLIRVCKGIDPGLYYYDPKRHQLCKIANPGLRTDQLLIDAGNANGEMIPQVLLCLAARFARVTWKYEGMAYASILKDVGALFQTMYLVATAMDLAACALGSGDSDKFAVIAETEYYAETTVGEFMLGSKP